MDFEVCTRVTKREREKKLQEIPFESRENKYGNDDGILASALDMMNISKAKFKVLEFEFFQGSGFLMKNEYIEKII